MSYQERLTADMKSALKAGDRDRLGVIRHRSCQLTSRVTDLNETGTLRRTDSINSAARQLLLLAGHVVVRLLAPFADALLLPEQALVDRNRRRVVFVVEDGVARQREPLLAAGLSDALIVLAGLQPSERIVIEGQQRLVDGTPVRIQPAE